MAIRIWTGARLRNLFGEVRGGWGEAGGFWLARVGSAVFAVIVGQSLVRSRRDERKMKSVTIRHRIVSNNAMELPYP